MDIYLIKDRLEPCTLDQAVKRESPYVCAAEADEFQHNASFFDLGMDLEPDLAGLTTTKAEVNFDSVIGTFDIPDRRDLTADHSRFAFAFDEKGIVFIGGGDYVREKIASIIRLKKWRFPSLERFLFDFLEQITDDDLRILEAYDARLDAMEDRIQASDLENIPDQIADIRGCVSDLNLHAYPMVFGLCVAIVTGCVWWFKKNKWL